MEFDVTISPTEVAPKECAKITLASQDGFASQLYIDFTTLLRRVRPPGETALDFLLVGAIVYALDKLVPRTLAGDYWSRCLAVTIPVREPDKWNALTPIVNDCLSFLSGDEWQVSFRQSERSPARLKRRKRRQRMRIPLAHGNAVCLFSGGLDSLVGAIDWLETHPAESLVAVGHHDPSMAGPLSDQTNLLRMIREPYRSRLCSVLIGVGQSPSGSEITMRSRSLVFVALGIAAAHSIGENTPLLIPENGTMALNTPLTPSRRGSCSTRTAHPYYLKRLQQWLDGLGLNHRLENPLSGKTKGEVAAQCANPSLLQAVATKSVSCAKRGHTVTWKNRTAKGCGRCMPCIYRRAALHKIQLDQELYGVDICQGDVDLSDRDSDAADDFRACVSFLTRNPSRNEIARMLVASGPLDPTDILKHADTVLRAMDEIRELLKAKGTPKIGRLAGLVGRRDRAT